MTKPRSTKSRSITKRHILDGIEAARLEYVCGADTYEALAEKYGVTAVALRKASERGGWVAERKAFRDKVRAEVEAEAIEETKAREKETREAHYQIATMVRNRLTKAIMSLPADASPSKFKDASTAGLNVYKWQALALGMSTENRHVSGDNVVELVWPSKAPSSDGE